MVITVAQALDERRRACLLFALQTSITVGAPIRIIKCLRPKDSCGGLVAPVANASGTAKDPHELPRVFKHLEELSAEFWPMWNAPEHLASSNFISLYGVGLTDLRLENAFVPGHCSYIFS